MILISWLINFIFGLFSLIFLFVSWAGLFSIVFAVIGIFRKRCKIPVIFMYLGMSIVGTLLFRADLWFLNWLSTKIDMEDRISTGVFWGGIIIGLIGLLSEGPKFLKQIWIDTNSVKDNQ